MTESIGVNDELFVKVLARIEMEPDTFNMEAWGIKTACATTLCLAGHAIVEAKVPFVWEKDLHSDVEWSMTLPDNQDIGDVALDLFGLTPDKDWLFYLSTDLDLIYNKIADLMNVDETVLRDKVQAEVKAHISHA